MMFRVRARRAGGDVQLFNSIMEGRD